MPPPWKTFPLSGVWDTLLDFHQLFDLSQLHWFLFIVLTCKLWNTLKSESHSVVSNSLQPQGLYSSWNSPGQNTGVGSLSLLHRIFPNQESNRRLLHYMWIILKHSGLGFSVSTLPPMVILFHNFKHHLCTDDSQNLYAQISLLLSTADSVASSTSPLGCLTGTAS